MIEKKVWDETALFPWCPEFKWWPETPLWIYIYWYSMLFLLVSVILISFVGCYYKGGCW